MRNTIGDLKREPLGEQAYHTIKEMIVTGGLAPDEEVPESVLAKRLGISRSPVKAALTRLRDDGLVIAEAWKAPRVAPLDARYVTEVYQMRQALDVVCGELAVNNIPDQVIDDFDRQLDAADEALENGNLEPVGAAYRDFHRLLVTYADNSLLKAAVDRLHDHLARVRNAAPESNAELLGFEMELMRRESAAVRDRDAAALSQALRIHLERFRDEVVQAWPREPSSGDQQRSGIPLSS